MYTSLKFYIHWSLPFILETKRFTSLENRHIGVYFIWKVIDNQIISIYAGQGEIGSRLKAHRGRYNISKYNPVYATWAKTPYITPCPVDGIEKYLINTLQPVECIRAPRSNPIEVNLPNYLI